MPTVNVFGLDLWHLALLVCTVAVLGVLTSWGWSRTEVALTWCRQQRARLRGEAPQAPLLDPQPLVEREQLLAQTDMLWASQDLPALLLRRTEVPGHHFAALLSNLLVSVALFFTIVGLILTLFGLGKSLETGPTPAAVGQVQSTDLLENLIQRVQGPLGRLPYLFLPTALGMLLALGFTYRQRQIDEEVDGVWEALDQHTQARLFEALRATPKPSEARALEEISAASREFAGSAADLRRTFDVVEGAVGELRRVNQSSWATELVTATDTFGNRLEQSGQVMAEAGRSLSGQLASLPEFAGRLQEAGSTVVSASGSLQQAVQQAGGVLTRLSEFQDKLIQAHQDLQQLDGSIAGLGNSMNMLSTNFVGWSRENQRQVEHLRELVSDLNAQVSPLLQAWAGVSQQIQNNADVTRRALEEATAGFTACNQHLAALLRGHQEALADLGQSIAEEMRLSYQRFEAAVGDRLDQGEGLYERLDALREAVESDGHAASELSRGMQELRPVLQAYAGTVEQTQGFIGDLRDTVIGLARVLQQAEAERDRRESALQAQSQAREEAWRQQFQQFEVLLSERLSGLQTLERLERLERLEHLGRLDELQHLARVGPELERVSQRLEQVALELGRQKPASRPWWQVWK